MVETRDATLQQGMFRRVGRVLVFVVALAALWLWLANVWLGGVGGAPRAVAGPSPPLRLAGEHECRGAAAAAARTEGGESREGCAASAEGAALALAQRRCPEGEAALLRFRLDRALCAEGECFSVAAVRAGGAAALEVRGSSRSALSLGLGALYRRSCGVELLSWATRGHRPAAGCVQRLLAGPGSALPCSSRPCRARAQHRYYLNVVTYSYSLAWWGWARWEEELDWMALRGVNVALAPVGHEALWARAWQSVLGASEAFRAEAFFTGAAYLSWHRMGNLEALGAAWPRGWLEAQLALQRRLLARMAALGIRPVLPGFNLHVPEQVAARAEAEGYRVARSSRWSGFGRPHSALRRVPPDGELARGIARAFMAEQLRELGEFLCPTEPHFYSVDIFNEMDSGDEDAAAAMRAAAEPLLACDDAAVLVVQMWAFAHAPDEWPPRRVRAFMDAVPRGRALWLDLHGDKRPQWRRLRTVLRPSDALVWTLLHNFGGTKGVAGELEQTAAALEQALAVGNVRGLGLAMEGIEQNELLYDLVLARAWDDGLTAPTPPQRGSPDAAHREPVHEWALEWARRRYALQRRRGRAEDHVREAWACGLRTAYARPPSLAGWGTTKSVIEMRPATAMRAAGFQPTDVTYAASHFRACAAELLKAATALHGGRQHGGDNDDVSSDGDNGSEPDTLAPAAAQALAYDLVDWLRQALCDEALLVSEALDKAVRASRAVPGLLGMDQEEEEEEEEEQGQVVVVEEEEQQQAMRRKSMEQRARLKHARAKDDLAHYSDRMLRLISLTADVLETHWMWRTLLTDVDSGVSEEQLSQWRELFTTWSRHTQFLHSYASRLAADVVRELYLPRWSARLEALRRGALPPLDTMSVLEDQFIRGHPRRIAANHANVDVSLPRLLRLGSEVLAELGH
jgi:hypothetical protein